MKKLNPRLRRPIYAALVLILSATARAGNISYSYDPAGRLVAADYGGGNSASYAYDNAGNLFLSASPSPELFIWPIANHQFSIAWPSEPAGFALESTTTLGPGAIWQPVGGLISQMGDLSMITLSAGPAITYYRLRK